LLRYALSSNLINEPHNRLLLGRISRYRCTTIGRIQAPQYYHIDTDDNDENIGLYSNSNNNSNNNIIIGTNNNIADTFYECETKNNAHDALLHSIRGGSRGIGKRNDDLSISPQPPPTRPNQQLQKHQQYPPQ